MQQEHHKCYVSSQSLPFHSLSLAVCFLWAMIACKVQICCGSSAEHASSFLVHVSHLVDFSISRVDLGKLQLGWVNLLPRPEDVIRIQNQSFISCLHFPSDDKMQVGERRTRDLSLLGMGMGTPSATINSAIKHEASERPLWSRPRPPCQFRLWAAGWSIDNEITFNDN